MAVLAAIKREEPKDDDNDDEGDGVKQEGPKGGGGGKPLDEERRKYIIRTRTTMLSLIIPALGPVCFVFAAPFPRISFFDGFRLSPSSSS